MSAILELANVSTAALQPPPEIPAALQREIEELHAAGMLEKVLHAGRRVLADRERGRAQGRAVNQTRRQAHHEKIVAVAKAFKDAEPYLTFDRLANATWEWCCMNQITFLGRDNPRPWHKKGPKPYKLSTVRRVLKKAGF